MKEVDEAPVLADAADELGFIVTTELGDLPLDGFMDPVDIRVGDDDALLGVARVLFVRCVQDGIELELGLEPDFLDDEGDKKHAVEEVCNLLELLCGGWKSNTIEDAIVWQPQSLFSVPPASWLEVPGECWDAIEFHGVTKDAYEQLVAVVLTYNFVPLELTLAVANRLNDVDAHETSVLGEDMKKETKPTRPPTLRESRQLQDAVDETREATSGMDALTLLGEFAEILRKNLFNKFGHCELIVEGFKVRIIKDEADKNGFYMETALYF